MTLTLAAVYAPIALHDRDAPAGCSRSSRWTLAGAVVVSGFVALTLTPMMCSQAAQAQSATHGRLFNLIERGLTAFEAGYRAPCVAALAGASMVVVVVRWAWRR